MIKNTLILFLNFFILLASQRALAQLCQSETSNTLSYRYCYSVSQTPNAPLLIYFHGIYASEKTFFDKHLKVFDQVWTESKASVKPSILSFSMGPVWFLSENRDLFLKTILPSFVSKLPSKPREYFIYGQSMGGFNAAQVFMSNPGFFSRAVFQCPAFSALGPYTPLSIISNFYQKYKDHIEIKKFLEAFVLGRYYFRAPEVWDKYNPLNMIAEIPVNHVPIYIFANTNDNYGFNVGAEQFNKEALDRGFDTHLSENSGFHCQTDLADIAKVLIIP